VEIPRGKVVRGNNLLPFLKGDEPADWDDDFYTYLSFGKHIDYTFTAEIRALRTPKYKLVRDFANPELHEFYDLRNDPGEHRNLIGSENPKIKKIIEELDKKICAKMEETNDPVLENKKENTE